MDWNDKEQVKAWKREYQKTRKEKNKEASKRYCQKNVDKIREFKEKWRAKDCLLNPWSSMYYHARGRCLNSNNKNFKYYGGRGIKFNMTKEDFKRLWFRDKAFNMEHPSIDRIDNNGNYEYNNCQFIELSENAAKARRRKVIQKTLNGKIVKIWDSMSEASGKEGFNCGNISGCCSGKYKTSKGFKWEYWEVDNEG